MDINKRVEKLYGLYGTFAATCKHEFSNEDARCYSFMSHSRIVRRF